MTETTKSVRWGIISTARIAESAFIPAVGETSDGAVVAVASRYESKAMDFARKHGIPVSFANYESLLASDEIDAVYIALPNTMHHEWALKAAARGKHVFCEKPLATSVSDAEEMCRACGESGVVFFEAFVFLYHPQTLRVREIIDSGEIGRINHIQSRFCSNRQRPSDDIRLNRDLGGGCIFDMGSYPITYSRFAFRDEPEFVQASVDIDKDYAVDTKFSLILTFPGNRFATIYCSFDNSAHPAVLISGDSGYIDLSQPFHPPAESSFHITSGKDSKRENFENGVRPFTPAVRHFHDCVLNGTAPLYAADNALGTLRVIEAAFESAETGRRVAINR